MIVFGRTLDQGMKPHCVCYSGSHLKVFHERMEHRRTLEALPDEWYARTKEIDPWGPGVDGTGVRYAAKVAANRGVQMASSSQATKNYKISSYVRLTTLEEILVAISRKLPVWFGISVDRGIFTPQNS